MTETVLLQFVRENPEISSKEIFDRLATSISYSSVKRLLKKLNEDELILKTGRGKATKYSVSEKYNLLCNINIDIYFEKEIDERKIKQQFNFDIIEKVLSKITIFSEEEFYHLNHLQDTFLKNISELSETEKNNELERLAIDLSWKSSQIEGNTYSLLETERLLKEQQQAKGKTKEEATMLLNHKKALDFIFSHKNYLNPLSISKIEDVHNLLTKDLGIQKNIRKRRVGISGTNYKPLDNEFQIREALEKTCNLINAKSNIFEKALLVLVLLSYIQAFSDGNKRTARIVSNAILIANNYCPLSFRTVDSIDYKKAMLVFYEQNNIHPFKQIFINQFEFAVNTYF